MRRSLLLSFIFMPLMLAASTVEIEGDVLYYSRDHVDKLVIAQYNLDGFSDYFTSILTTNDVAKEMHNAVGFRAIATINPSEYEGLQFRYLGLLNWKGERQLEDVGVISLPLTFSTFNWFFADRMKAIYTSDLSSYDLNYWSHVLPKKLNYYSFGWGLGVRYIKEHETFRLFYFKGNETSIYRIKTDNNLIGGQLLVEFGAHPVSWFTWGLAANVGPYANAIVMRVRQTDKGGEVLMRSEAPHGVHVAWAGELQPFIEFNFFKILTLKVAYDIFYIRDLALAPEQIVYNTSKTSIDHHSGLTFHGFMGGLKFSF